MKTFIKSFSGFNTAVLIREINEYATSKDCRIVSLNIDKIQASTESNSVYTYIILFEKNI